MADRKDVTIHTPAAVGHQLRKPEVDPQTLPEIHALLAGRNQDLAAQVEELRIVADTMTNVALCMQKMMEDHGLSGVARTVIPGFLSSRMVGAAISVSEGNRGEVIVTRSERPLGQIRLNGR